MHKMHKQIKVKAVGYLNYKNFDENQNNNEPENNTHTKQSQKTTLTKHFSNCHIFILP